MTGPLLRAFFPSLSIHPPPLSGLPRTTSQINLYLNLCLKVCFQMNSNSGVASGKKPACQCRRHKNCGFDPWIGKIPWRRAQQPTPVFLPGESHGQRSLEGYSLRVAKSRTQLKCLSMHACNRPPDIFIEKLCFHYTYKHAYKGRYNKVDRKTILNHSDLYFEYSDTDE